MPAISRQVGTVSSLVNVFIPNATVSTGAGLANIVASTVVLAWYRNDMSAVSSTTLTTGTLGTWASSTMTQIGSTSTLGWYQVSVPNGVFVSGDNALVHLAGAANMAPVPVLIELTKTDNQSYLSTQVVGRVNLPVAVSSISTPVTASSVTAAVNVSSIYGSAAVTSAAGVWGPLEVSSLTTPVTVSAGTVRVSAATIPFSVSSGSIEISSLTVGALGKFFDTGVAFFSTAVVSSVVFEIATNATAVVGNVNVSGFTAGALNQFFTTDAGDYSTSVLGSVVQEIANNVSATVGAQVGVSSISVPVSVSSVTDKAGYGVSSISTPVTASTAGVTSISVPVGVSSGSVRVTSASIPFGVSSLTASALGNFFDTGALFFSTAVVSSVVLEIASNVVATVGAVGVSSISVPVGVSSISTPVSVSAGTVRVSAVTIPVGVSTGSVAVTSATAAVYETAADTILNRNVAGGSNTGRVVKEAFYAIRNKVDLTNGVVYGTDDTTSSWAFTVSTSPVDPVVSIDPS
jgi:hypothetical protein